MTRPYSTKPNTFSVLRSLSKNPFLLLLSKSYLNSLNELVYFAGEEDQDYLSDEDEMLLGKWQNTINEQWYRVYTDEEAEDGYYWGYEWDENEDVTEEDLNKYGNGWFMWKKRGSKVLELATADNKGQLIPRPYTITKLFYTELAYKEVNSGKKLNFLKVTD